MGMAPARDESPGRVFVFPGARISIRPEARLGRKVPSQRAEVRAPGEEHQTPACALPLPVHQFRIMPSRIPPLLFSAGFLLLTASCAHLSSNARRSSERLPQANDPLTGGGTLAMTAVRATAVATLRQPVTTAKLGFALLWHRPREIVTSTFPVELEPTPPPEQAPGTRGFERQLDREGFPPAERGSVKWLVDGPGFFTELDRQIAHATTSIDCQVFIFDNDDIAVRYADVLKRRAAEVPVRVMFDDLGSTFAHTSAPETLGPRGFVPPVDMVGYLRQDSKLRVRRTLNPWLVSDHTKLLVFDRRCAILGGMNIGREYYSEWHDLMVCVDGPIVGTLQKDFNRTWRKAGPWGDFAAFRKPFTFHRPKPTEEDIPLRVLQTDASIGRHDVLKATLMAIRAARKRVWIENPYFAHDEIALALANAARRGVDVRVIIPAKNDSTIMDIGNLATARGLIEAGGKVYRYPKMTHMKVMLCDDWGTMGSANLDTLSMRINRELNLAFTDPAAIRGLERQVFEPDFRRSPRMKLSDTAVPAAPLAEVIADQL